MGANTEKYNLLIARLSADAIIGAAVLSAHTWVAVALMVALCFLIFRRYYEGIIFGLIYDLLYGTHGSFALGFPLMFTVSFALVYGIISYVKTFLRGYEE